MKAAEWTPSAHVSAHTERENLVEVSRNLEELIGTSARANETYGLTEAHSFVQKAVSAVSNAIRGYPTGLD